MSSKSTPLPYRTIGEWSLRGEHAYANPFVDVDLHALFTAPSGARFTVPGFYDGDGIWRVRFNPGEVGRWTYRTVSRPMDPGLNTEGTLEVFPHETRGYLRSTPGQAWGFRFESGEPAFLLGDTTYNLFGMAHCGGDVPGFLRRRAEQGFDLLRVRLPVSPFHPPEGYSDWQTRRTWPWGGSEQAPQFDRFNLDYFHTVDEVMHLAEELDLGFEMVMEAWGFEWPFNNRGVFVSEWEDLWLRYLVARYDAFRCVYIWTLMNEYEYYPDGDWRHNPLADRWAIRRARWMKRVAPHGHPIAVHNGPQMPPFAQRFRVDPQAVDTVMFQTWGSMGDEDSWLAAGIEADIETAFADWPGSAIFAEYGYERNPDLPVKLPYHENCNVEHTRRGAWRGAFCGLNVVHGFENSWGPFMVLEEDQPGVADLLHMHRFFTEIVPFDRLHPAPDLVRVEGSEDGRTPRALASSDRDVVAVYLPIGGEVALQIGNASAYEAAWYDPRTGTLAPAVPLDAQLPVQFQAPEGMQDGHPWDWVLVLKLQEAVRGAKSGRMVG